MHKSNAFSAHSIVGPRINTLLLFALLRSFYDNNLSQYLRDVLLLPSIEFARFIFLIIIFFCHINDYDNDDVGVKEGKKVLINYFNYTLRLIYILLVLKLLLCR